MKATSDKVIARIKTEREALRADPKGLYNLVHELILPHFDFVRISQWVLGKHWRTANPQQRSKFIEEFRTLLVRTYAMALLEYADRPIKFLPVHADPQGETVTIKTEVEGPGNQPVPMNYRLHIKGNEWKVFDVSVDRVSLISTYRASFASEIRQGGLDALISSLETKNTRVTSNSTNTGKSPSKTTPR